MGKETSRIDACLTSLGVSLVVDPSLNQEPTCRKAKGHAGVCCGWSLLAFGSRARPAGLVCALNSRWGERVPGRPLLYAIVYLYLSECQVPLYPEGSNRQMLHTLYVKYHEFSFDLLLSFWTSSAFLHSSVEPKHISQCTFVFWTCLIIILEALVYKWALNCPICHCSLMYVPESSHVLVERHVLCVYLSKGQHLIHYPNLSCALKILCEPTRILSISWRQMSSSSEQLGDSQTTFSANQTVCQMIGDVKQKAFSIESISPLKA